MVKITKSNFEKAIRKRGRPPKEHLESQDDDDGGGGKNLKRLKKTRLQQKSSMSPDPFFALNMMPGITPESPKKDHCDLKPKVSYKGKEVVRVNYAAPPNFKVKVCN
jgi:hypothetical protein